MTAHDVPEAAANLVALLADEGVSHLLINPGTDSAPLQEALAGPGWALGGAFGIKLARPEAPVVAICGDGSFNFGVPTAAFWSAHRYGAPFVAAGLNNQSYWASKAPVIELYPDGASVRVEDFAETELTPATDYAALVRACGGAGQTVHTRDEIGDAVRWALAENAEGRCAVLDVRLPQP